jgi:hypothetical protein
MCRPITLIKASQGTWWPNNYTMERSRRYFTDAGTIRMTELTRTSLDRYIRGVGVRQIRLACGLVLFGYLLSHFINHALGNISADALATGVRYHTAFWKSLPIATAFYAAAGPYRPRHLGALPAPSIPLEGDRADTTCAGFKHPCPHHHPSCRCAV